jgi:dihydroorotase
LNAIELYAEAFDSVGAIGRLEGFASFFGADFYGLPRNREKITLIRCNWTVPQELDLGGDTLVPLRAGETMAWKFID